MIERSGYELILGSSIDPQFGPVILFGQGGTAVEVLRDKALAGVGVIFYVLLGLRARLKGVGWFERQAIAVPNMADFLDLVALGTVADVVPLDRNNRVLVEQGLRRIRAGQCVPGITALMQEGNRDPGRAVASDLGFCVAPRLNAAGRLDDISVGIRCLLTESLAEAKALARACEAAVRSGFEQRG